MTTLHSVKLRSKTILSLSLCLCVPVGGGGAAARHDPVDGAVLHLQDVAALAAVLERRPHPVGGAHPQPLRADHRGPVQPLRAENFDGKETELSQVDWKLLQLLIYYKGTYYKTECRLLEYA